MVRERICYSPSDSPKGPERSEQIKRVNEILIGYLAENPPSLAHGYSHFRKVTEDCCSLAIRSGERLDLMYYVGLCHDIYRPAEGKDGKEDHEVRGGEIIREKFRSVLSPNDLDLVVSTIVNHDEAIKEGRGTKMMKILTLADKSDMSAQRCIAYAWASNKNSMPENIKYPSFKSIFDFFRNYRSKADGIFEYISSDNDQSIQEYKGKAEAEYTRTEQELASLMDREEKGEIEFGTEIKRIASQEAMMDVDFLKRDGVSDELIAKVAANYGELLTA
jgi:hypothetical protein